MHNSSAAGIHELIQAVHSSKKYASVDPDLVRAIGERELAARKNLKEAIKATKNKLHQVAGAYLDQQPPYQQWLKLLAASAAQLGGDNSKLKPQTSRLRSACLEIMRHHASTRERLPILDQFYATTLRALGPVRAVLDVACGLNPLALAWMPLADECEYHACDIYADMAAFLNGFFQVVGVRGRAEVCDLVSRPPRVRADLALVLKALPVLEQIDKHAGRDLLRALDAPHMLVSFPARSLGGRGKGMVEHYEERFRALAAAEGWAIERFVFASELAFLVRK
jgi:16S rRNA (guanine(1405)-N(7))-methyltransferase